MYLKNIYLPSYAKDFLTVTSKEADKNCIIFGNYSTGKTTKLKLIADIRNRVLGYPQNVTYHKVCYVFDVDGSEVLYECWEGYYEKILINGDIIISCINDEDERDLEVNLHGVVSAFNNFHKYSSILYYIDRNVVIPRRNNIINDIYLKFIDGIKNTVFLETSKLSIGQLSSEIIANNTTYEISKILRQSGISETLEIYDYANSPAVYSASHSPHVPLHKLSSKTKTTVAIASALLNKKLLLFL